MTVLEVHNAIGFANEEDNWELVLSKEHNTHWFSNFNSNMRMKFSIIEKKNSWEIRIIKSESKPEIGDMKTLCEMINSDDIQELLFTKEVKTDRPN